MVGGRGGFSCKDESGPARYFLSPESQGGKKKIGEDVASNEKIYTAAGSEDEIMFKNSFSSSESDCISLNCIASRLNQTSRSCTVPELIIM